MNTYSCNTVLNVLYGHIHLHYLYEEYFSDYI